MYDFSFLKGSIETIILNALYSGPKYGYEIAREIKEKTDNKYEIKQPTLYGYLKRLQENGLIVPYWGGDSNGGRRRYYQLTDKGEEICIQYMSEWNFQRSIIDNLVAQPMENSDIREISQDQATSLLGSKTKRTHKKRNYVSDDDLEELNKQLVQLNANSSQSAENNEEKPSINEVLKNTAPAKPQFIFAPTHSDPVLGSSSPKERIDVQDNNSAAKNENVDLNNNDLPEVGFVTDEQNENSQTKGGTNNENNDYQDKPSINEEFKNMPPAKPQLIFAPTPTPTPTPTDTIINDNRTEDTAYDNRPLATESSTNNTERQDDTPYKQLLGSVIGSHLDEMSKAKFDSLEKFDTVSNTNKEASGRNVNKIAPLDVEVEKLNSKGITASVFDSVSAMTYKSQPMMFVNKVKFIVSLLITLSIIVETIALYFIFKTGVDNLKFGLYAIVIALSTLPTIYYSINYFTNPTKKKRKVLNFKFNFVNSWIFVGSMFIIFTIIFFVIIGTGDLEKFFEFYLLPFILSLNAPLGVFYHKLLVEKAF